MTHEKLGKYAVIVSVWKYSCDNSNADPVVVPKLFPIDLIPRRPTLASPTTSCVPLSLQNASLRSVVCLLVFCLIGNEVFQIPLILSENARHF